MRAAEDVGDGSALARTPPFVVPAHGFGGSNPWQRAIEGMLRQRPSVADDFWPIHEQLRRDFVLEGDLFATPLVRPTGKLERKP